MMSLKLALGTAQFGLDYGINNKSGKISKNEVDTILHLVHEAGIIDDFRSQMQEMVKNALRLIVAVPEEQKANFTLLLQGTLEDI